MGNFMKTGEVGFCPTCGTVAEVVVLPQDRLQARIAKAAGKKFPGIDQPGWLPKAVTMVYEAACWAVDDLYGIVTADVEHNASEGQRVTKEALASVPLLATWIDADALGELRETLLEIQMRLCLAAEALSEAADEPVDLMRLAAERLENSDA